MAPLRQYTKNLNADPEASFREAQEHGGELVARSLNGRDAVAYASTREELYQLLAEKKAPLSTVVIERVLPLDETFLE